MCEARPHRRVFHFRHRKSFRSTPKRPKRRSAYSSETRAITKCESSLRAFRIARRRRDDESHRDMSEQLLIVLVVAAYLAAGFVKGVLGMGLPNVALALLASVISPAQAAAILIAPSS